MTETSVAAWAPGAPAIRTARTAATGTINRRIRRMWIRLGASFIRSTVPKRVSKYIGDGGGFFPLPRRSRRSRGSCGSYAAGSTPARSSP